MKPQFEYNGLRKLLLPKQQEISLGPLVGAGKEKTFNAIKLFEMESVVLVYKESDNKYREACHDNYINCAFAKGTLRNITGNALDMGSGIRVSIDDLFDVIRYDALEKKGQGKLKIFDFLTTGPNVSTRYSVIHTDPARAYLDMRSSKKYHPPVCLSAIRDIEAGIQFNDEDSF